MRWLAALAIVILFAAQGHAQGVPTAQEKINQLIALLQDPDVQSALQAETRAIPNW